MDIVSRKRDCRGDILNIVKVVLIPWREKPGRLLVHGVAKSRTRLSDFTFTLFRLPQPPEELSSV